MRRSVFLITCFIVCIGLISGCGQPKQDENTITVWHWMTDRHKAFEELALRYESQTGVAVKFDLYAPSGNYTQKIIASSQAKVLPDIYGILDNKETFGKYINYGFVADLTEDFKADNSAWQKSLFDKALNVNRFEEGNIYDVKPGFYGVPIDVTNMQMLYNKDLLKKAGITSPPKTFSQFLEQASSLRRQGIAPFVSGWGEVWMMDVLAWNYAFNIMGHEKVMATYKGEVPYTDPDWIEIFRIFESFRQKEVIIEGIISKPNKEAEQDFALGRAAFAFNGSWGVNTYKDLAPDLQYGTMLPPVINTNRPMKILGGAGSSFVVNRNSSRKEKAVEFLKWFTSKEAQTFLAEETNNLPANREAVGSISPVLSGFADDMDNATHPTIWKYNENPRVSEAYLKGIQSIILGEQTPEEVAQDVQAVKARELAKEKARK